MRDRETSFDASDVESDVAGRLFRCWINEDTVKGDYVGQSPDLTPNVNDHVVDGRFDLVYLIPREARPEALH